MQYNNALTKAPEFPRQIQLGIDEVTVKARIIEDIADKVYVFGQDRRIAKHGSPAEILADTPLLQANNLIHRHSRHARDHRTMMNGQRP
ncbi:MAG: hypothetical protein NTY53_04775 [Kiritimatiellaeota bacterium]|nr:hypothetical protein [Kiritimatiellota bacterium]